MVKEISGEVYLFLLLPYVRSSLQSARELLPWPAPVHPQFPRLVAQPPTSTSSWWAPASWAAARRTRRCLAAPASGCWSAYLRTDMVHIEQ
ncbi:uncharacterized protein [Zea mays]|uniref:uncharacterized protein LOC111274019 n=1 Tax=Zea mays TaxID=4577 RepID=UPI000BFB9817|nr:uncharacterized protein LOC111274019 [Zea mays]NP_001344071.1 uncharacterized protein LOC111274019 [Zea mays]XP_023156196.1 uncharacterized protein LOC111274019 isoform X1 [Zea mays]XP_023156198.1 uncharacterized protein LOC111274019 isoform X1 [Zea mays]|eukprot:NP_001344070.1 uncharacterized protein LOC111274019 [Zea mays]